MAITTHVLVVANQTVDAPALRTALEERARSGPIHVTLLVPVPYSARDQARTRIDAAIRGLNDAGISASSMLGHEDPIVAVQEAWNPGLYDEIVVSTLSAGASRWLQVDLPHRIAKLTDCSVKHVEVREPRVHEPRPLPEPERRSAVDTVLGFLQPTPTRARGR